MSEPLSLTGDILIVDDTSANLRLLKELLGGYGFKVRPAISGELALQSALNTPPDLILLDIRMPGMDGYEVCRRLKAEPTTREIPVIFISAMGELRDRIQGFELGAVDYITKPFEREEVLQRVRTHLELHQMRSSLELMVADRTAQLRDNVRALRTLSGVNQALVHAGDEAELLLQISSVIHQAGEFPLLWIGRPLQGRPGFEVLASQGGNEALIDQLAQLEEDNPTRQATLTGEPQQCPDLSVGSPYAELTPLLVNLGLGSAVVLPLCIEGEGCSALTLFNARGGPIDPVSLQLLTELAEDLVFGLLHLRNERARKIAERSRLAQAEQLARAMHQTIQAVALTVEKRDPYTAGHQARVADLALAIGRLMGLEPERLEGLQLSAMIHDLGKIYIPAEILSRPGSLSDTEWQMVQTHPQVGQEIIQGVEFPWPVAEIILQHHERLDGSGYPGGLRGEQILLEARIIAVADVVDAMSSHRPYRPAKGVEPALQEIESGSGQHYDAEVVASCIQLFREQGYRLPEAL